MQKQRLIMIILFVWSIQISAQTLKPSETHAVVSILVVDESDKPLVEKIELISQKTGKIFKGVSSTNGMVELTVPINDTYILNMSKVNNYDMFEIPAEPHYSLNFKVEYNANMYLNFGMSLLKLRIISNSGNPIQNELVTIKNLITFEEYTAETDTEGSLTMELPYNASYNVNFLNTPDYNRFHLPKIENYILDYQLEYDGSGFGKHYPSMENGLLLFSYLDLDDQPVPNEKIEITSKNGGKVYNVQTNQDGKAHLLVPLGDKYTFSSKYFKAFQNYIFPDTIGLYHTEVIFKAISSEEFETRKRDREELLRLRDSLFNASTPKEEYIFEYKLKQIEIKALEAKKRLTKSPNYFEKLKNTVNAVFYRQRNRWKEKVIIIDVTCSMDPYLNEVYLWHALKLSPDYKNEYIFFNDGDGKTQEEKIIGETGGFHYTNSVVLDSVILKGWHAQSFGCSGDGPENDFEAILKGMEYKNSRKELILVADNYSDVRDYSLISKINVPVRIILCGVHNHINEQYLNLAYHTKGSVHSIEEDLDMLKRISYGSEIKYLGKTYIYTKGGFIFKK